jgi:ABC-type microcin C transport system permease subunit YejE
VSATLGALIIGVTVGAIAGFARGIVDELAMRAAELVLILPTLYVILSLRAALPLVLQPVQVFAAIAAALACLGWPGIARGVRSIVAVEFTREYVEAARAAGASPGRLLLRHVLPATYDFLAGQAALLVSAFVIAESTLSFVGFGFQIRRRAGAECCGTPAPSQRSESIRGCSLLLVRLLSSRGAFTPSATRNRARALLRPDSLAYASRRRCGRRWEGSMPNETVEKLFRPGDH